MTLSTEGRPDEKKGSLVINFDDNRLLSELFEELPEADQYPALGGTYVKPEGDF